MRPQLRRQVSGLVIAIVLVASAACSRGDGGGPVGPNPSLTGHWSGSAKLGALDFAADFVQSDDSVTGTGSFSSPLGGGDFDATGSSIAGAVDLILNSTALGRATYKGRFIAANRVKGTLDAPGYANLELTIDR